MAGITTHVLDTSIGRPAAGIAVSLEMLDGDGWTHVGSGSTDRDGRLADLLPAERVEAATIEPCPARLAVDHRRRQVLLCPEQAARVLELEEPPLGTRLLERPGCEGPGGAADPAQQALNDPEVKRHVVGQRHA